MFNVLQTLLKNTNNKLEWGNLSAINQAACAMGTANSAVVQWQCVQPIYVRSVKIHVNTYCDNNGAPAASMVNFQAIESDWIQIQKSVATFFCYDSIPEPKKPSYLSGSDYFPQNKNNKIILNFGQQQMIDKLIPNGQFGVFLDMMAVPGRLITPFGSYYNDIYVDIDYALITNSGL